jgi:hypothetical protein
LHLIGTELILGSVVATFAFLLGAVLDAVVVPRVEWRGRVLRKGIVGVGIVLVQRLASRMGRGKLRKSVINKDTNSDSCRDCNKPVSRLSDGADGQHIGLR